MVLAVDDSRFLMPLSDRHLYLQEVTNVISLSGPVAQLGGALDS